MVTGGVRSIGRAPRSKGQAGQARRSPDPGDELRMLTALRKAQPDSGYVFTSERGTPFTPDAINRLVKIIGQRAGLPQPVHFHMLRHSCGYKLANDGIDTRAIQDWLGQVSITHTTRYTAEPDQVQELLALEVVHPGSLSQTAMPGPANASCRSADRSRRGPAQSCSSSGAVDP